MAHDSRGLEAGQAPPISVRKFARLIDRSLVTIWRWRKAGFLSTINIAGHPFITAAALAEFNRRAEAGEFARPTHVPRVGDADDRQDPACVRN